MSFHRAENFGATMQVLALLEYLKSAGCEVEIIDYRCKKIDIQYNLYNIWHVLSSRRNIIASIFNYVKSFKSKKRRKKEYKRFWSQHFVLSSQVNSVDDVNRMEYDVIVIGSDQVWNIDLTGGYDRFFWGYFDKHTRVISYAASSESNSIKQYSKDKNEIIKALSNFYSISCREKALADSLTSITGLKIETVLDPTLLQKESFYNNLADYPSEKNYILVYHLTESVKANEIANLLSEKNGLPVIEIYVEKNTRRRVIRNKQVYCPGPSQLLGYIANARYVLSTSFHGTVLSLIYKKQIFVVDEGNNQRMKNLLGMIGLNNHIISGYNEALDIEINYDEVWKILSQEVIKSQNFLKNNIW